MVSPNNTGSRVSRFVIRREYPEPAELGSDLRILAFERIRQHHPRSSLGTILFKNGAGDSDLFPQWLNEGQWQDRDAVLAAFTFAYQHCPALQIDILDAQLRTFGQAHAGTIEHPRHQLVDAAHLVQTELNLGLEQDNWAGRLGRLIPSIQGNSMPRTSLYRNDNAHKA